MVCSLFGHSNVQSTVYPRLCNEIENLILANQTTEFLVGTHGAFDRIALHALRTLKEKYPHISYRVVLAYMPGKKCETLLYDPGETILPEGIEVIPKRYAISWRNKWMVRQSEIILCYITHPWGGAAKTVEYGIKQKKKIINIGEE